MYFPSLRNGLRWRKSSLHQRVRRERVTEFPTFEETEQPRRVSCAGTYTNTIYREGVLLPLRYTY